MNPQTEALAFQQAYNEHIRPLLRFFADQTLPSKATEDQKTAKTLASKFAKLDLRQLAERTADPTDVTPALSLAAATPIEEPPADPLTDGFNETPGN